MIPVKTFLQFVADQVAALVGTATQLVDTSVGSILLALIEANSNVAAWLQALIVQVLAITRLSSSTGADADSFVEDFGAARLGGTFATVPVEFSRFTPGQAASIPVGALVRTPDYLIGFTVQADPARVEFNAAANAYTLAASASAIFLPVIAAVAGASGNVVAGAISVLSTAVPGIDTVTNVTAASGGLDAETDAALRTRFQLYIASRDKGTGAAIAYYTASVQPGIKFRVLDSANADGSFHPAYFTVVVDDGTGSPPGSLLTAVQAAITPVRVDGVSFGVQAVSVAPAAIIVTLTTPPETHALAAAVFTASLQTFVAGLPIGGTLAVSRIAVLGYAADPSVQNVTLLSINGQPYDLTAPFSGVVQLASVQVN